MAAARIERILCPFDLSEPSLMALAQAVACARWTGARLTALRVIESGTDRAEELTACHGGLSESILARIGVDAGSDGIELVTRPGRPATEILAAADTLHADLIVIGTHGASGFDRAMLGSVAEKVLRRASCPVLTVPPHSAPAFSLASARVLCAVDFSDCSLAALEFLLAGSLGGETRITLLHVLEWPWHEPPAPAFGEIPRAEAEALQSFRARREAAARTRLEGLEPEGFRGRCSARISHGRPSDEILRVAAEEQSNLIVLGVHGRSVADLALFGSTAQQLVRRADCPVLTVRK